MVKLLFVCTGNTCRSPMAEYLLKSLLKKSGREDIKVSSAGLRVDGENMSANAREALKKLGVTVRRFKPKQATSELCRKQNAIVCMTCAHKNAFSGFDNVYTIGELTGCGDVADPYGGSQEDYDACATDLLAACESLLKLLDKNA